MGIENLSAENKIKLIIAKQIVVLSETENFELLTERLNMLNLKHIHNA